MFIDNFDVQFLDIFQPYKSVKTSRVFPEITQYSTYMAKHFKNADSESYWKIDIYDIYNYIMVAIALIVIAVCVTWSVCAHRINILFEYYESSEELLDSLDAKYDWVDAFDSDAYYSANFYVIDEFNLDKDGNR